MFVNCDWTTDNKVAVPLDIAKRNPGVYKLTNSISYRGRLIVTPNHEVFYIDSNKQRLYIELPFDVDYYFEQVDEKVTITFEP
jgi:hypothetical protein